MAGLFKGARKAKAPRVTGYTRMNLRRVSMAVTACVACLTRVNSSSPRRHQTQVPRRRAPIADTDALAMEGGTRVIWNNTAANIQTKANSLAGLIQGGGTAAITSDYRPQALSEPSARGLGQGPCLRQH